LRTHTPAKQKGEETKKEHIIAATQTTAKTTSKVQLLKKYRLQEENNSQMPSSSITDLKLSLSRKYASLNNVFNKTIGRQN
jgi:hypothetical protein